MRAKIFAHPEKCPLGAIRVGLSVRHGVAPRNQVQVESKASQNLGKSEMITYRGCVS
jgi:hypothetical protein